MTKNPIDLITGQVGPPPERDVILIGETTVIEHCKQEGVRLAVEESRDGQLTLKCTPEETNEKFGQLVRLWRAFTRHDIHYPEPDSAGITSMKSSCKAPQSTVEALNKRLGDDASDIRRLSTLPITRCFVYLDVSDFSQQRPGQQALIVGSLASIVRNHRFWNNWRARQAWTCLEEMLCIGDGYIFVLKDVAHATYFAAFLAQLIEVRMARNLVPVEFHFRMGVHVGPVYCFWDWGRGGRTQQKRVIPDGDDLKRTEKGDWNFIGDGINGGQRVLAAIGKETDDVLFISAQVRQDLIASKDAAENRGILDCLSNRGRRVDKHNRHWRVYELNHSSLCGKAIPPEALA